MEQEAIIQEALNTSPKYLFSITKLKKESDENYDVYDIRIYKARDKISTQKVGEFTVTDLKEDSYFFKNLKVGIERELSKMELLTWTRKNN